MHPIVDGVDHADGFHRVTPKFSEQHSGLESWFYSMYTENLHCRETVT